MALSNTQAFGLALIPGRAEILEKYAESHGNMALNGMVKNVKYSRDAFYLGVALTTLTATGVALINEPISQYTCMAATFFGAGVTTLVMQKLYEATVSLQQALN